MRELEDLKDDEAKQELVECFVSEYKCTGNLTALAGFLKFNAQIPHKLLYTNEQNLANIMVDKKDHTKACAIGSLYMQSLVLQNKYDSKVFVVLPTGEKTNDFDKVLKNSMYAKFLTRPIIAEVDDYNNYELVF